MEGVTFFKTLLMYSHYCVIVTALKSFYILIFIQIPEEDSVIIPFYRQEIHKLIK